MPDPRQHIGDLDHYEALQSHRQAIADLTAMYGVDFNDLLIAHDAWSSSPRPRLPH
jgi:hydrogenase maturation factor HypF (carbamoyltransferase family)